MTSIATDRALLLIDFINEIVAPEGIIATKGYADFDARHGTLDRVGRLLRLTRRTNQAIIHVRVGFSGDYKELPASSPLLGGARAAGALQLDTWATDFHPKAAPAESELCLTKHRVSAFYGTPLEIVLRTYGIRHLAVAGCATDVAVQTAVREAHDRDFACSVIGDCCMAANDDDHAHALRLVAKVAKVVDLAEFTELAAT
jgi:nicotinamidase-related amidase